MAKQINRHIKLSGTIDELSFYKSQDGFLARAKGGVSGDRIKSDPKFKITRLNGQEFGTGGKAGELFRFAWNPELKKAADNRVASRITQLMVRILKTDPVSEFGQRKVSEGDLSMMKDFEFNAAVPLKLVLTELPECTINRTTGQVTVDIPALTPEKAIVAPEGATHYNIFAAAAAIDFDTKVSQVVRQSLGDLPWDGNPVAANAINLALPANSLLPVFLVVGIEFLLIVNGKLFPMSKGQSALKVVAVDLPA